MSRSIRSIVARRNAAARAAGEPIGTPDDRNLPTRKERSQIDRELTARWNEVAR